MSLSSFAQYQSLIYKTNDENEHNQLLLLPGITRRFLHVGLGSLLCGGSPMECKLKGLSSYDNSYGEIVGGYNK